MAIMLSLAFPIMSQGATLPMISGTVYVDVNGDGSFDNNELGVRGDTILLFDQNDPSSPIRSTMTDMYGRYSFTDIEPGLYTIRDTTPSLAGNMVNVGKLVNWSNSQYVTNGAGDFNSAMAEITDIKLENNYRGFEYNFGNSQYPMQLYSKYLLTYNRTNNIQPAIVTPVPEPSTFIGLLAFAGVFGGWALLRRR
jgi:hypothetical protein